MNLEKTSHWLSIVANVGLLIGIVLVIFQVNQAQQEIRQELSQGRTDTNRQLILMGIEELNLQAFLKADTAMGGGANPFLVGLMEQADLTPEEASRVWAQFIAWVNCEIQIIPQIEELSSLEREVFNGAMLTRYSSKGVSRFLNERFRQLGIYTERTQYIDTVIANYRSIESGSP
jgi:hypothetical protein